MSWLRQRDADRTVAQLRRERIRTISTLLDELDEQRDRLDEKRDRLLAESDRLTQQEYELYRKEGDNGTTD